MLFRVLYINTALLYFTILSTESQFRSLNMREDEVLKSALSMIRAARFCNFAKRSKLAQDVDPQVSDPNLSKGVYTLDKNVFEHQSEHIQQVVSKVRFLRIY